VTNNDDWEEIFDSIEVEYLPIEYVKSIAIRFNDKTIWDIDINDSKQSKSIEEIELILEQLFEEYQQSISSIDYTLDFSRIKKDLSKRVYRFLKLNK
jgi:hypothetical protein|tara:strand:- start:335 stop:625 length:291 start_codon:yes stop_codon:yes gene_type:complete